MWLLSENTDWSETFGDDKDDHVIQIQTDKWESRSSDGCINLSNQFDAMVRTQNSTVSHIPGFGDLWILSFENLISL